MTRPVLDEPGIPTVTARRPLGQTIGWMAIGAVVTFFATNFLIFVTFGVALLLLIATGYVVVTGQTGARPLVLLTTSVTVGALGWLVLGLLRTD